MTWRFEIVADPLVFTRAAPGIHRAVARINVRIEAEMTFVLGHEPECDVGKGRRGVRKL